MNESAQFVLDASAVLAVIREEPGSDDVEARIAGSLISSVNWCEVLQKARQYGASVDGLREEFEGGGLRISPFTIADAERTAELWESTRSLGLSLGDRACLALAERQGATAVTADRQWTRLDLGIPIEVIR